MGIIEGTNAGFVTAAPNEDPGDFGFNFDFTAMGHRFTGPADAATVTEIGWYCFNATEAANYDVGIYTDAAGNDEPNEVVGDLAIDNAKGTGAGWKKVSGLSIPISGSNTIYWICVQLDDTATATAMKYNNGAGAQKRAYISSSSSLPSPWGTSNTKDNYIGAFYALYETAATGTNTQVNVGDTWKECPAMKVNIGDTWKEVAGMQVNVGDTWKNVF